MKRKIIIMMKFNREEGLTLIELLITIAVLAIVAAIAVPVVTNVVASSNANAATQTENDIRSFVEAGNKSGIVLWDGGHTFESYVDLNGNNVIEHPAEKVSELVVDTKFTIDNIVDGAGVIGGAYDVVEIQLVSNDDTPLEVRVN